MPNPDTAISPKHLRKPRRTIEQGRVLVQAWKASGLSAKAFGQAHGVDGKRLSFWQRRVRKADREAARQCTPMADPSFIRVEADNGNPASAIVAKSIGTSPVGAPSSIEISLPNGIRLVMHADTPLARLVAVVDALVRVAVPC